MRILPRFLLLLAVLSLVLGACATTPPRPGDVVAHITANEPLYRAAVELGVLKVLEKNPTLAPRVQELAGQATAGMAAGEVVSLATLEGQIRQAIRWEKLTPEETVLLDTLIVAVRQELDRTAAGLQTPEEARLLAVKVLEWVEDAAALATERS